jgi:hypothetical protein
MTQVLTQQLPLQPLTWLAMRSSVCQPFPHTLRTFLLRPSSMLNTMRCASRSREEQAPTPHVLPGKFPVRVREGKEEVSVSHIVLYTFAYEHAVIQFTKYLPYLPTSNHQLT